MNGFSHLSLLIDLDSEQWWPEPAALTATTTYFPKRSRRLLHESLHYWQQLSQVICSCLPRRIGRTSSPAKQPAARQQQDRDAGILGRAKAGTASPPGTYPKASPSFGKYF